MDFITVIGDNMLDFKKVSKHLEKIRTENGIVGMAVAVTDRNQTLYSEGFGLCDVDDGCSSVSGRSLFRIASITKIITGLTALKMVDAGVLELDAPITQYLPWFSFGDSDNTDNITLRRLLSHTAGMPAEYTPDGTRNEADFLHVLKDEISKASPVSDARDCKYLYSNLGIRLAAAAMEAVSGERFSALARKSVLEPIGMTNTAFHLRDEARINLCYPHEKNENGEAKCSHYIAENAARYAAGGLYSNSLDLSKLARLILMGGAYEGGRIISEESFSEMLAPSAQMSNPRCDEYGLTMMMHKYKSSVYHGHLGSAPPYATSLFVDRKEGYGVVTLMNSYVPILRHKIPEMIFDMIYGDSFL